MSILKNGMMEEWKKESIGVTVMRLGWMIGWLDGWMME